MTKEFKIILLLILTSNFLNGQEKLGKDEYLLEVLIIDEVSSKPIPNSELQILGTDSLSITLLPDSNGVIKTNLRFQQSYYMIASAPNYLTAKGRENGPHASKKVSHLYELSRLETCKGILPLFVYDYNNFDSPKCYSDSTCNVFQILFQILEDNPNLDIELIGYRDKEEVKTMSNSRAIFTKKELVSMGIDKSRLEAVDGSLGNDTTRMILDSNLNGGLEIDHNRMLDILITN